MFLTRILKASQQLYKEKKSTYASNSASQIEYVRWTFLPSKDMPSFIGICTRQHMLCSEYGIANCVTLENKSTLLESLKELDSLIFEEYELRVNSFGDDNQEQNEFLNLKHDYDSLKTKLIDTFIKNKQVDSAIKLAEKYVAYDVLVSICESKQDQMLLESYLNKFSQTNEFAEFVIKTFMEKKKLNFLLKNSLLKRADLSECFNKYPFLSWIKDIKNNNFTGAYNTLQSLGRDEKTSFMKKKSLLSMSKLNLLANAGFDNLNAKDRQNLNNLNRQLQYLSYFDNLPASTLKVIKAIYSLCP